MTKLSEAIREGAKLHPKGTGDFVSPFYSEFRTCALGAAFEHIHSDGTTIIESVNDENYDDINRFIDDYVTYKFDLDAEVHHPDSIHHQKSGYLKDMIMILNDNMNLDREEIADLLDKEYEL